MAVQVGNETYNEFINRKSINEIKDLVNFICLNYAKLSSKEAMDNRESDSYDVYSTQYKNDLNNLTKICTEAQKLVNLCNETLFFISNNSLINHLYQY